MRPLATPTPVAAPRQEEAGDTLVLGAEHREPPAPPPAEPLPRPFGPGSRPLTPEERTTFYRLLHPDFSSLNSNRDPINAVRYLDPDHEEEGIPSALPTLHETVGGIAKSIDLIRDLLRQGDPGSEFRGKTLEQRVQRALDQVADWKTRAEAGHTEGRVIAQLSQAHDDLRLLLLHAELRTLQREQHFPGLDSVIDANWLAQMRPAEFNAQANALSPRLHSIADDLEALGRAGSSGHPSGLQRVLAPSADALALANESIGRLGKDEQGDWCVSADAQQALQRVDGALALLRRGGTGAAGLPLPPLPDNRTVAAVRRRLDEWAAQRPAYAADAVQFRASHIAYAGLLVNLAHVVTDTQLSPAAQNDAIASLALEAPLPLDDARRIEFARIASLFLHDDGHEVSAEKAKRDLCRSVLPGPPGQEMRPAEIEAILPDAYDRLPLLVDALPQFVGRVDAAKRTEIAARARAVQNRHGPGLFDRDAGSCAEDLAASFAALDGLGDPLQAWRLRTDSGGPELRDIVAQCLSSNPNCQKALGIRLHEMATDLTALRGRRQELIQALEYLSDADGQSQASHFPERLLETAQRDRILEALIAQLPDPAFGGRETQNMVIDLLRRECVNKLLPGESGVARVAQLATVMPALPSSSVMNTSNPQGVAAKLIEDALRPAAALDAAPVLEAVLDSVGSASRERSASSSLPTTRTAMVREGAGMAILAAGSLGLVPLWTLLKGSPSPQKRLVLGVGDYLMDRLGNQQLSERESGALLPIVRRILTSRTLPNDEDGNRLERQLQARALMALCRSGLPLSADDAGRSRLLGAAIGTDPAVRKQAVQALTDLCRKKHEDVDSTTRMGAARLLLALDRDTPSLPDGVRIAAKQAFQAAVGDAGSSRKTEPKEAGINLAILRESAGAGAWLSDELKQRLARTTVKALLRLPPASAAEVMPLIVENLPQDQYRRLGRRLAKYSDRALPQVLLALVGALGRFPGRDPGPLVDAILGRDQQEHLKVWGRLPETLQATALLQHLPIALGEAGPAGRGAILAFIEHLGGARRADAACALLKTLADGDVVAAWDAERQHSNDSATNPNGTAEEQVERALAGCLHALRNDAAALGSVAKEAADCAGSLPDSVLPLFIQHAQRLQPVELRSLMSAWLGDLRFKTPDDTRREFGEWAGQARGLGAGPQRAVMHTLLFLAQQAHRILAARPGAAPFEPDFGVLRDAMPGLHPRHAAAAARRLAEVGGFDGATVMAVVAKLPGIRNGQARTALLRLCHSADEAATLMALCQGWGQAQVRMDGSGADRPNLQQAVPVSDTETATLQQLLDSKPAAIVAPALGAMAARVGAVEVPPPFIREFGEALDRFMQRPDATAQQRAEVLAALVRPTVERGTAQQVPGVEAIRALVDQHLPALEKRVLPREVQKFNAIMAHADQQDATSR